ncbi:MAG: amino acid adenylation enzyme/thioester reductase family protein [Armatimonadetes bacterium CSP1-3]|nr:MAG: amino acid adenylation enzyme/thioester reductase family protein [Armatimonadetes bacterium CSP1-3]
MTRQLLHHLLVETAERSPEATAVAFRGETMTYGTLDAWSDRLAHLLVDVGVRRGDRVGIYREKSSGSVAAIYAILKAGAAYVPLDPHAPPARLAYIARNCGLRWLITAEEKLPLCRQMVEKQAPLEAVILPDVVPARRSDPAETLPPGVRLLAADAVAAQPASPPAVRGIELDLAYILYTSGSTGEPKGVMISHLNSLAFVRWAHQAIQVRADDVLSNHAPWHFDLSIFDVFAAVLAGATLAPVPAEMSVFPVQLAEFIAQTGITVWYSVPSVLNLLLLRGNLKPGAFPRLRTVLFAGEVFPTPHLRRLMGLLPHARFYNLYGPTETNVCTWYEVPPLPADRVAAIPIGRAIDNVEVFAMTEEGRVAAPGEVGELYVRGSTVALGYWGDSERTARGFVSHPSAPFHERVYRTGDLVRQDEQGDYLFLGRRDNQVKSRGYRIELGDVEAAIYAHPEVAECAVAALPDAVVGNRLKAFVVTRGTRPLSPSELVQFCSNLIPRYMVPEEVEFRDRLPKTSTGKIDRTELVR